MELISQVLAPYKDIIGTVAGVVTMAQFISPIPLILDFRRTKTTSGFSVVPFLWGAVFGILNLQFGLILNDATTIRVNTIGVVLSSVYLYFFYNYTKREDLGKLFQSFGIAGGFLAAALSYAQYENPELIEYRFGILLTAVLFYLIGAPLFQLKGIIRNKSTHGLPFPMIATGSVVSTLWMLYGFALNNPTIAFQNVVAVIICLIQLSLFAIYPSTPPAPKAKLSKRKTIKKDN
jgi:solute carrier family 50 protein (sugar transporter)